MDAQGGSTAHPWLTGELRDRLTSGEAVLVADIDGFPLTPDQLRRGLDDGDLATPYTHLRPGAPIPIPQLGCTAGFVFRQGERVAIATAGHCTTVGSLEATLLLDPTGELVEVVPFGRTIFARAGGMGRDLALIEVFPELHHRVHPATAIVDGPCGWRAPATGDTLLSYGHGRAVGAGGTPRAGVVVEDHGDHLLYVELPAGAAGDSGAPVRFSIRDHAAAGIVTHGPVVAPITWAASFPGIWGLLEAAGETGWELMDSPNCGELLA